jgi:ABC-2 type transport system ATP-binding protein
MSEMPFAASSEHSSPGPAAAPVARGAGHHRRTEGTDYGAVEDSAVAVSVIELSKVFRLDASGAKTAKERLLHPSRGSSSKFTALEQVSFDVAQGETFGVLGHNGSGKSTLLKLMAGIMRPTAGRVLVRGRLAALLELGAGFHPDLTGRENIYLNGSILGLDRNYVRAAFNDIVDFAELHQFIDVQVKHYSSGMRARLGFSVATHLEPDVLLIDEVLAVGDETFRNKCMERVHKFRSMGRTMIIVSHSADTVRQLCSRAAVLDQGRLIHLGPADDAIVAYRRALNARQKRLADNPPGVSPPAKSPVVIESAHLIDGIEAAGTSTPPRHRATSNNDLVVKPGTPVTVVVTISIHDATVPVRLRITLRTPEGLLLINRATSGLLGGGGSLDLPEGRHEASFHFGPLPLRDGQYLIDVTAETPDGGHQFARRAGLAGFSVEAGGRGLGLLAVPVTAELATPEPTPQRRADDRREAGERAPTSVP